MIPSSTSGDNKLSLSFTGSSITEEVNIHTAVTNSPDVWNQYSVTYDWNCYYPFAIKINLIKE